MKRIRAYLGRHWRGELSLPLSFIGNGQIGGGIVGGLIIGLFQGSISLVTILTPGKIEDSLGASVFMAAAIAAAIAMLLTWAIWAHVGIVRSGYRTLWLRPGEVAPPARHILIAVLGGMVVFLPTSPPLGLAVLMIGASLDAPWPW